LNNFYFKILSSFLGSLQYQPPSSSLFIVYRFIFRPSLAQADVPHQVVPALRVAGQQFFMLQMAPGRSCTALNAEFCPYKKALSLIFALQIRESAFVLLTMRLLSQRIRSTPNSEKIIRQPSLFQHYALIGVQRVGGVGVVTQQFLGIGPAYGQGLSNFPLPQVAENQQLRLAVIPAIG
jgi:hypothetical protein